MALTELERLTSSSCWRVMTIYNMGVMHPRLAFVGVEILTNFCFLGHSFGSRHARKPIKGCKDSDNSLISKKTWAKKLAHWNWIGAQGRVKLAIKTQNHPYLWRSPKRTPNPKLNFFSVETTSRAESVDGLNTSLALAAGELWPKKYLFSCWFERN